MWGHSNATNSSTYTMPAVNELTEEYDWTWVSNYIYIYSPTDPNARYYSVEVGARENCIYLNDKNYLRFDNLDIRYSKLAGYKEVWPFKGTTRGLEISNNHISHIGIKGSDNGMGIMIYHSDSWIHDNEVHDCGRRAITTRTQDLDYYVVNYLNYASPSAYRTANGPMLLENITFENNTCYDGYHALMSMVSEEEAGLLKNAIVRNNLLYDSPSMHITAPEGYSSGALGFGGGGMSNVDNFENVLVYNNIIISPTGYGLNMSFSDHIQMYNNLVYGLSPNSGNSVAGTFYASNENRDAIIKNNIFYNNYSSSTYNLRSNMRWEIGSTYVNVDIDHNLYYLTDINQLFAYVYGKGLYNITDYQNYKTATGWDTNSLIQLDPLFVDPSNRDFHLQSGSPAIGAGINVGLTTDYDGNPYNSTPSIGPFEFE